MITIDVSIEGGDWASKDQLEELTRIAITEVCNGIDVQLPEGAEIGTVFTDDARVKELNTIWRKKNAPTNVLSFAANDDMPRHQWSPLLGDIVLAQEAIAREAVEQNKTFDNHLTHLIIHGFLHLLGHDHENDTDAETMESLETRVLAKLGIADPYASA